MKGSGPQTLSGQEPAFLHARGENWFNNRAFDAGAEFLQQFSPPDHFGGASSAKARTTRKPAWTLECRRETDLRNRTSNSSGS